MRTRELDRRLRTVSRIALYGSVLLVVVIAGLLVELARGPLLEEQEVTWGDVDYASLEEVRLLREYVRIDTSEATGSTLDGARFLAGLLEEAGIPYTLERVGEKDANLWAVVEGERPGAVVLHHHIDVEDVGDPARWAYPPFAAEIDLPWLYGRGTFDMKSIGIAQLLAVVELVRSGIRPERSVILLATAGEETGSELGTRWVLREHPELVERFEVVLTEGGVVEGRSRDEIKYWGTEFAQKRYQTLVLCDPSRELLEQLHEDIQQFGALEERLLLVDEVRSFLAHYAPTRDRADLRQLLEDPGVILRDREAFDRFPRYLKALFRNEVHSFGVRPADDGDGWELPVKIHLLPGAELHEVRDELLPPWLFWDVESVLEIVPVALHGSPVEHPVLEIAAELISEHYPGAPVGPLVLPWTATDSRFFRAHGIPSYGFTPFPILTTDVLRVGTHAERIDLPGYVEGVAVYRDLLRRLANRQFTSPE
ncbi:MAG: M20/M25/M40 family metallo-hydrolase [Thermoanaerobaculia bacterium]